MQSSSPRDPIDPVLVDNDAETADGGDRPKEADNYGEPRTAGVQTEKLPRACKTSEKDLQRC